MALLVMILRKMIKNKWLELSLLLGLILSVALVSSMPIYSSAILQRMLVKDLENLQLDTGQYPGAHWSSIYMGEEIKPEDRQKRVQQVDEYMKNTAMPGFTLPILQYVRERSTDKFQLVPTDTEKVDARVNRIAEISAMTDLEKNIRLVDGRLPAKQPVNGVYEALVVEGALTNLKMVLGNEFTIKNAKTNAPLKIKPVGVIDRKDYDSLYWYNSHLSNYNSTFFIDFDLFEKDFTSNKVVPVRSSYWYFALDYSQMDLNNVKTLISTHKQLEHYLASNFKNYGTKMNALQTIGTYFEKEKKLRIMLWSLNVPVMIMLGFYLFMVSNLIMDRQKTEIAVLRSRGASRWQIMLAYFIEGALLGIVAFIVGPFFGMVFTKILGASNGFLEFVQRAALKVRIDRDAYEYAFYAVASSLFMTLIPAFLATRATIVGHKQQMARKEKKSFWHRFFIDIILIGVSLYGLKNYRDRMSDLMSLGVDSADLKIDPLLFLVPALFILGLGLVILRIYPLFIRLVYWLGRKWWPPSLYSTLIQVGRSSTQYQFLMVFLIITIATGLFSASAARTMNQNTEDKIRYKNGADIVLQVRWENDAPVGGGGAPGAQPAEEQVDLDKVLSGEIVPKRTQWTEPPFQPFTELPGVEHAAKVFVKPGATFEAGSKNGTFTLMGIETDEFGRTAWMKDRLLPHHFYNYLNLIASEPSAVLISKSLAQQQGLKPGDSIMVSWSGVKPHPFVVYGVIDYWPSFNPNPKVTEESVDNKAIAPAFMVGHLQYIQNNLSLEPYDVWIKLKPDAERQQLYDAIAEKKIPVTNIIDTREELRKAKNDPFTLAINGVMTLGFLISVIISFFGFLLYWVLSLFGRILQLGILRAMGISFAQLIGMLITEQILTSGAAIAIGMLCGNATSHLFVPLFQIAFNPTTQVPPFQVTFDPRDSLQLYVVVTFMITVGLFILGYLLSRIKIHQAVKLGED